jgi:transcriptional regulator with XRE-family HTH domain
MPLAFDKGGCVQLPKLRQWRELRGFTQKELSELSGVSLRGVAGYEAGAEARPNTARKLAEALDLEVMDLAGVEPGKEIASPSVQLPLNGWEEERRDPTPADFRAVKAIQDRCNRLEAYLESTAGKSDPDDMDKLLLTTMLGITGLVGEIAPAVMEKESAHTLLHPIAGRFLELGKDLVAMAREWELPASEMVEAQSTVTDMQQWLERAS